MLNLLLLGGAAVVAGIAFAYFWKKLKELFQYIKQKIVDFFIAIGETIKSTINFFRNLKSTARKFGSKLRTVIRVFFYSETKKKWYEQIETTTIELSEVPDHIRHKMIEGQDVDISNDIQKELSLELA